MYTMPPRRPGEPLSAMLMIGVLPDDEKFLVRDLLMAVDDVAGPIRRFESALALWDHSEQGRLSTQQHFNCLIDEAETKLQKQTSGFPQQLGPQHDHSRHMEALRQVFVLRSERQQKLSLWQSWLQIAMRDGALQIYNFGKAIESINLKGIEVFSTHIDKKKLKTARGRYNQAFEGIIDIRHAIAHAEEDRGLPALGGSIGGLRVSDGPVFIDNSFNGRTYTTTMNGRVRSYELSVATLGLLNAIYADFCSAFQPALEAAWAAKFSPSLKLDAKKS